MGARFRHSCHQRRRVLRALRCFPGRLIPNRDLTVRRARFAFLRPVALTPRLSADHSRLTRLAFLLVAAVFAFRFQPATLRRRFNPNALRSFEPGRPLIPARLAAVRIRRSFGNTPAKPVRRRLGEADRPTVRRALLRSPRAPARSSRRPTLALPARAPVERVPPRRARCTAPSKPFPRVRKPRPTRVRPPVRPLRRPPVVLEPVERPRPRRRPNPPVFPPRPPPRPRMPPPLPRPSRPPALPRPVPV